MGPGPARVGWGLGADWDMEASILPTPHIPGIAVRVFPRTKHFFKAAGKRGGGSGVRNAVLSKLLL